MIKSSKGGRIPALFPAQHQAQQTDYFSVHSRSVSHSHFVGVGLDVLDGLQHTLGFVDAAAKAQVVGGGVLQAKKERGGSG